MPDRVDSNRTAPSYSGPEISSPSEAGESSAPKPAEASARQATDLIELAQSVASHRPLGAAYEETYGALLNAMSPEEKRTFQLSLKGGEEGRGAGHLAATAERDPKGGYTISIELGGGAGLGVDGAFADAEALAQASGKATLHFDTLSEAAGWLSAASQKADELAAGAAAGRVGTLTMRTLVEDRDVGQRLGRTLSEVESIEGRCSIEGEVKAKMPVQPGVSIGSASFSASDEGVFRVDFSKGTLTIENRAKVEGGVALGLTSGSGEGAERRGSSLKLTGGTASGELIGRTTYQLTPAQLQGLKNGTLSPQALMRGLGDLRETTEVIAKVEWTAPNGIHCEGERRIAGVDGKNPFEVHGGGWHWEAARVGSLEAGLDVGVFSVEGSVGIEEKLAEADSLHELTEKVEQRMDQSARDQALLVARRATLTR